MFEQEETAQLFEGRLSFVLKCIRTQRVDQSQLRYLLHSTIPLYLRN